MGRQKQAGFLENLFNIGNCNCFGSPTRGKIALAPKQLENPAFGIAPLPVQDRHSFKNIDKIRKANSQASFCDSFSTAASFQDKDDKRRARDERQQRRRERQKARENQRALQDAMNGPFAEQIKKEQRAENARKVPGWEGQAEALQSLGQQEILNNEPLGGSPRRLNALKAEDAFKSYDPHRTNQKKDKHLKKNASKRENSKQQQKNQSANASSSWW